MRTAQENILEERMRKLREENISLREALSSSKAENENLRKFIGDVEYIFHSDPSGIIILRQGKIININSAMMERLGYTHDEITGMMLADFFHPDESGLIKYLQRKIQSGKLTSEQYEVKLLSRQGTVIVCELWIKKIRLRNKIAYLLNFGFIEKLKEEERKNYLKKKRDALVVMASGLSSELHRCFEDVEQNIRDMESIAPENGNRFVKNLNSIKYALERVVQFTRYLDILSGEAVDEKRWVYLDINSIINDAVSEISLYWKEKLGKNIDNIVLKSYLRSVSMIRGDLTSIKAAIAHIILNAIEAVQEGGEILITTEDNAGSVCIFVQDNGMGIPEEIKDSIFDPFFTKRGRGSLGLGLSLCETIIERHGGKIEITSDKDQGCTVEIELPLARKEKKNDAALINKIIKRARVLIIQDKDFLREVLSQMFSNKGLRVDTADSGWEGLGKMKKRKVSLIVADTEALKMDTANFIKKCRGINSEIRIVIIEGHKGVDSSERIGRTAADLIISKPLDANMAVKSALNLIIS